MTTEHKPHQELVERVARGLRAGHEFINELPLTDGASPRAKDREFVTVTLIPDGLMALDRLEEQCAEATRLLALVTQIAKRQTKWEPGLGYVALGEADAFLNEVGGDA